MPTNRSTIVPEIPAIEPRYSDTEDIWIDEIKARLEMNTDDTVPFLLMPLRIETRFIDTNKNGVLDELWVRVYPDDILIQSPENKISESDVLLGESYWEEWWKSGGDENKRKGAWRALCNAVGSRKAAWIVKKTKPKNYPVQDCGYYHKVQVGVLDTNFEVLNWYQDFNYISRPRFTAELWSNDHDRIMKLLNNKISKISANDIRRDQHEQVLQVFETIEKEQQNFNNLIHDFQINEKYTPKSPTDDNLNSKLSPYLNNLKNLIQKSPSEDFVNDLQIESKNLNNVEDLLRRYSFSEQELTDAEKSIDQMLWNTNLLVKKIDSYESINTAQLESEKGGLIDYYNQAHDIQQSRNIELPNGVSFRSLEDTVSKLNLDYENTLNSKMFFESHSSVKDLILSKIPTLNSIKTLLDEEKLSFKRLNFLNYFGSFENINNFHILLSDRINLFRGIYEDRWVQTDCLDWNVFDHLPENPDFPSINDTNSSMLDGKPLAKLLPDRFVAVGLNVIKDDVSGTETYDFIQLEVGNQVPSPLTMGIDPSQNVEIFKYDTSGNLEVDSSIKWMFDFEEAVSKGMAIKMKLTGTYKDGTQRELYSYNQTTNVFDKLIVLGVKNNDPILTQYLNDPESFTEAPILEDITKEKLEELFNSHHYSASGMDFLEIGTPTNNTSEKDSGYNYYDMEPDKSFGIEVDKPLFIKKEDYFELTDGQRMSDLLGLEYDVFEHIQNSDKYQISDMLKMNKVLFNGTIGHFMQEMLGSVLTYENIESTKQFFNTYVSARGLLPSIRVNNQPYGILTTSSWTKWKDENESYLREDLYGEARRTYEPMYLESFMYFRNRKLDGIKDIGDDRFFLRLKEVLDYLSYEWIKLSKNVDYVGKPNNGNAQEEFMRILGLHSGSAEYFFRKFSNNHNFLFQLLDAEQNPFDINVDFIDSVNNFMALQKEFGKYEFSVNSDFAPRILAQYFLKKTEKLIGNKIDSFPLSEKIGVNNGNINFIHDIANLGLNSIYSNNDLTNTPHSLLFLLLRQSKLLSHADIFLEFLIENKLVDFKRYMVSINDSIYNASFECGPMAALTQGNYNYLFEQTLENLENNFQNYSFSGYSQSHRQKTVSELIMDYKNPNNPMMSSGKTSYCVRRIEDFKSTLLSFRNHETAKLNRLMQEHIDLCSYRLDAWMTGFINKRLTRNRQLYNVVEGNSERPFLERKKGIYVGAYGWLDNIKPGGNLEEIKNQNTLPEKLRNSQKPIYKNTENLGYLQAPSLAHAVTAAILRSGYNSNKDNYPNSENGMAVSLTSERVKKALFFVDGIKNGQTFGALLGYQFEKGLHDKYSLELDEYIYPIRRKFPLVLDQDGGTTIGSDNIIKPQNVVDGISLIEKVKNEIGSYNGTFYSALMLSSNQIKIKNALDINSIPANKYQCIALEIDYMADNIDAVADLAISEGVFQVVKGNYSRASSALDSLSKGQNLSELEIVKTPRSGISINHKIALNFDLIEDEMFMPMGWQFPESTSRAKTDPSLNNWISTFLPHANNIKFHVSYKDSGNQEIEEYLDLTLIELQPIDLLYFFGNSSKINELTERIVYRYRQLYNIEHLITIQVKYSKKDITWAKDIYTIQELTPLFKKLYKIVTTSRSLNSTDYEVNAQKIVTSTSNLNFKFENYHVVLNSKLSEISSLINSYDIINNPNLTTDDYRAFLIQCQKIGFVNCTPFSAIDPDSDELKSLMKELSINKFEILTETESSLSNSISDINNLINANNVKQDKLFEKIENAVQVIYGEDYKIFPMYKISSFVDTLNLISKSQVICRAPLELNKENWIFGLSKVREKVEALQTMYSLGDKNLDFTPIQFPFTKDKNGVDDFWYGVELPSSYIPTGNKYSLCIINPEYYNTLTENTCLTGLLIDEWIEIIPEKKETTGISFFYDQPNMKPPQNLLLAVTPEINGFWNWDNLIYTLLDTQLSYKIRAVEPDHIQKNKYLGQMLPAIIGPVESPSLNAVYNNLYFNYGENNVIESSSDTLDNTRVPNFNNSGGDTILAD